MLAITAVSDWVSPTGFQDAENRWTEEARAYDENTSTYASDGSNRTGWGAFIVLTLPAAINSSRIRVNADWWDLAVDSVDIDVFRDGAWVDVWDGVIANSQWEEKTFTTGSVTQARFRWRYIDGNYNFWMYEFDFFEEPLVINPPVCQTENASKVEENTAILHGLVINDGGEPCEFRFQYGETVAYGNDTPWRSSRVTGETFAELITGLTDGQTYHFHAQLRNSSGTSSGADKAFSSGPPSSGWVSPSGNNDPDTRWDNESWAYDDDLNSLARSYHDINDPGGQWSSFLHLTHAIMLSDKLRYYARGVTTDQNFVDQVDVDVFRDGAWVDVYEGAVANLQWEEHTFTQGNVTESRIRFHSNTNNAGLFFELYEFNFFRISLSPPVLTWTGETNYTIDGLDPESGDALTDFTFRVEYTDADNDSPSFMKLHIDKNGDGDYTDPSEEIDMAVATDCAADKRDGDFSNGEIYSLTTTIFYGPDTFNCSYYFSASDGTDNATGDPTSVINAPDVEGLYYVRSDGNDSNTGLGYIAIEAWKTISKAAATIRVGEIFVAPGTYNEQVNVNTSGTSLVRVYFTADIDASEFPDVPPDDVILDATGNNNAFYLNGNDYITIRDFRITGSAQHGIFLENDADYNDIYDNFIYSVGTSGVYSGIRVNTGCNDNRIFNNRVQGDYYGVYLSEADNCQLFNNMIYGVGYYGFYIDRCDNLICYFNAVYNTAGHCVYKYQGTGNDFKNNIFYDFSNNSGYYCFYNADGNKASYTFISDYNDLYAPNGASTGYYGSARTTLGDWQSATGEDANSISTNPFFVSSTDLHLRDVSPCQGQGTALVGYTTDYDGDSRADPPDLGMDENLNTTPAAMSGTYTVKEDGSGNYLSIIAAVSDLVAKGVSAPVIIDIYSGTYMGQVDIDEIPGVSAVNTVTIREAAGETATVEGDTYVFYFNGADYVTIEGLDISNCTQHGMYLTNYANNNHISKNYIYGIGTSGGYSCIRIDMYSINNTVSNNQVYGDYFGIYLYNASGTKILFNSIYNTVGRCIYKRYGTNNDFKNNVVYNSSSNAGNYCFYSADSNKATYTFTSDYNDLYSPNGASTGYYGGVQSSFTDWQTATGEDTNSISANPIFTSGSDMHIENVSACQGAGTTVAGITTDYDGDARATPPDIGMDENLNPPPVPMSGNYSIKQDGSGDYLSFSAAVNDLTSKGINNHVIFDVYTGTYMEQIDIIEISGVGTAATITFRQATGESVSIEGNTYVFYLDGADYINIENFDISNCSQHGIYLESGANNNSISGNNIHDIGNTGNYAAIRFNNSDNNRVYNNQILSDSYGIYMYYASDSDIYFNSIYNTFGRCIHKYRGSGNDFKNNIFCNTSSNTGNYCFYNQDGNKTTYTFTSDYNDFYVPNGARTGYYGGAQTTLVNWRTATGEDVNSITEDPKFVSATNLHVLDSSACQGTGVTIAGYTTDYDGDTRADPPDIGMDENLNPIPLTMHGNYTVKQDGSGDYLTISAAVADLILKGIDAAVVIDVYSGTYTEQVDIPAIAGAGAAATITFREATGEYAVVEGNTNVFLLDGADYVILEGFELRSCSQHGIFLINGADHNIIRRVNLHDVGSTGNYAAIRCNQSDDNQIYNNQILSDYYGIYLYYATDSKIYYNSIYNTSGRCIHKYRGSNNEFKNNILCNTSNSATNYCFYNQDGNKATYSFISDYNDFYTPSGASAGYYGGAQATFANWQTATGEDANSFVGDPIFGTSTDLHIAFNSSCQGQGVAIPGYTEDYDGDTRADPPDVGMDEKTDAGTPMNGNYTVKQDGSGDYVSIAAAVNDLEAKGVDNAVNVDVYSGTYTSQIDISPIPGANSSNTITIKEAAGETATVIGQSYGFHLDNADYIRIRGFDITAATQHGFYLDNGADNNEICHNFFYNNGTSGNYAAVMIDSGCLSNRIYNNKINGDYYGIRLEGADQTKVFNNMIYGTGYYGIYINDCDNLECYFNSVLNTTGRCVYKNQGLNNDFKNNILYNSSTNNANYCLYIADGDKATYTFTSNNNDFYVHSGARTGYYQAARNDLASWQTATSEDAGSISSDPEFYSSTNLHISGASLCDGAGTTLAGYADDYDGQTRSTPPDIGADENVSPTTPMSGTYTVKTSGGDYNSIVDAAADLNTNGVSGAVSIDVYNGTYTGQIMLEDIPWTSVVNTVTIREYPGETVTINGDTYAFYLDSANYVRILDFDIKSSSQHGIFCDNGATNNEIHDNYLYGNGTSGNYAAIRLNSNCDNNKIYNNRIDGDYHGIYLRYADNSEIYNNMIYGVGFYGTYIFRCDNIKFYFNSIYNTGGRCLYKDRGTGCDFKNNILYNTSTNANYYCFYVNDGDKATYTFDSDYNDLCAPNGANAGYYQSARLTLSDWQTATSEDTNSVSENPQFISTSDLHLEQNSPCQGAGITIGGFTTDYDGDTRQTPPDLGADENLSAPPPPLSGIYTVVQSGGGDYTSIADAATDLNTKGVSGWVRIDVYSGIYVGQVTIQDITGSSATNTITFREVPGETVVVNGDAYGFYLNGTDYARISDFEITSTTQSGFYLTNNAGNNEIYDNYFNGIGSSGNYAAVWLDNNCDNNKIYNNQIDGDYYGIYMRYADNTEIYNNMIYGVGYYGIYIYRCNNLKFYFNSIFNTGRRCLYKYQGTGNDFKNNILYNSSTNAAYYCFYNADGDKTTYTFTANYNDFCAPNGASVGYYGGAQATLNDWRTATTEDANSISANPRFVAGDNLHIEDGSPCQGTGTVIGGYTLDFDGDTRQTPPDIGCDENLNPPPPPLSGTYTVVQSGGGDYTTIVDAVSDLNARGVSGPVSIDVYSGVYTGQVTIQEIIGASAVNTVTFREFPGETVVVNGDDYSFYLNGADYIRINGFEITSTNRHGIYFDSGATYNEIHDNYFTALGTSGNYAAIRVNNNCENNKIYANQIDGDYYGIYLYYADNNEIYNNMIYGIGYYGAYIDRSDNLKFYFNSILNSTGRCLYKYRGTGNDFKNNILCNTSANSAYYSFYNSDGNKATYTFTSDNNDFYVPNGASTGYYGVARASLTDWQTATEEDGNSLAVDPMFTSTTDLHIDVLSICQSKGVVIPGYTTDIDGDNRATPPDIGADEVPLKLIITPGSNNPTNGTVSDIEPDLEMIQVALTAGDIEGVILSSITFTSSGSGDDAADISLAQLYNDLNNDGIFDVGDSQINGDKAYSADNGTISFTINETIDVSSTENWLLVYDMGGTALTDNTFRAEIAQYSHINAKGESSGETIICEGLPVLGGLMTVDKNYDSDEDEIADSWEYNYYGNLDNEANSDTDSDGVNMFLEFILDTDPTDSNVPQRLYVNDNACYAGNDGSPAKPFKYLNDAIDAASSKDLLELADGTYTLTNYTLNKDIMIRSASVNVRQVTIKGPRSLGSSSNNGQVLAVTASRFVLSDVTVRHYQDDQPLISYDVSNNNGKIAFHNLIFKGNNTQTKSLVAPTGSLDSTRPYFYNCLFHSNTCAYTAELQGKKAYAYHNTIVSNTGGGILVSGTGDTQLYNNIIRDNTGTEIQDDSTGNLTVANCNIEGGYTGAIASYDTAPNFISPANDMYRILGAPDIDTGRTTSVKYDAENNSRLQGAAPDVGAYEILTNDTDADGLSNADEVTEGTDQNNPDSDSDGYYDNDELTIYNTDPTLPDTDGDTIKDGEEAAIGMDPTVSDGLVNLDLFDESFEDPARFPIGPWGSTIWGGLTTSFAGNIQVVNVGAQAYDGNNVITGYGQTPESYVTYFSQRNGLNEYWISWAFKLPRVKLPTDIEEALNIAGAYLAINENGFLCLYDGATENWREDTQAIPEGQWVNFIVHRNHSGKTVDIWVDGRAVFSNVQTAGAESENYIRFSFSSAGEYDIQLDKIVGYRYSPF